MELSKKDIYSPNCKIRELWRYMSLYIMHQILTFMLIHNHNDDVHILMHILHVFWHTTFLLVCACVDFGQECGLIVSWIVWLASMCARLWERLEMSHTMVGSVSPSIPNKWAHLQHVSIMKRVPTICVCTKFVHKCACQVR